MPATIAFGVIIAVWLLAAAARPTCPAITSSDLQANRALSFRDFDQRGTTPTTARALGSAGCFEQAVAVSADYLINGPVLTDYERNVVRWHMGQYLADAGHEREAALTLASTRRGTDPNRPTFDWDTYVVGTYAFLIKDRPLLDAMADRLSKAPTIENQMNAKVLRRFQRCFDQPYRIAYGTDPRCD